jgi:hypothetical protein
MNKSPLWFLLNPYGWLIFGMSVITAIVVRAWWITLFGVIGYQTVLLVEMVWGGNLGRTGRIRLAKAEQENRELRDERARLVGTIREQEGKIKGIQLNHGDTENTEKANKTP